MSNPSLEHILPRSGNIDRGEQMTDYCCTVGLVYGKHSKRFLPNVFSYKVESHWRKNDYTWNM
jgi:hypothetical protein